MSDELQVAVVDTAQPVTVPQPDIDVVVADVSTPVVIESPTHEVVTIEDEDHIVDEVRDIQIVTVGEQGQRGIDGATGAQGQQGIQGVQGVQGATGAKGDKGDPGDAADTAALTHAAESKTPPVDADELPLIDSAASWVLKKLTWANLKGTLKTYFDGLYPSGSGTSTGSNTGDNPGVTSITVTGANGIGVSGSPITSSGTIGLSLGAITPTSVSTPSIITASGALTVTPAAGSNFNLNLSTTGDFAVNTNQLYVDTSTGFVGIQTNTPGHSLSFGTNLYSSGGKIALYEGLEGANLYGFGVTADSVDYYASNTQTASFTSLSGVRFSGKLSLGDGVSPAYAPNAFLTVTPLSASGESLIISTGYKASTSIYRNNIYTAINSTTSAGNYFRFDVSNNAGTVAEVMRLLGTGSLCLGTTGTTIENTNRLQIAGTTAATNSLGISAWSADALGSRVELGKSRGAAIGTNTIVQSGDVVGSLLGYGANGSTFTNLASISMEVDGTPGATNDMPGRIVFKTTPNGSGTLAEAMRLSQDQTALFASSITTAAPTTGTAAPWKLGTLVTGQVGLTMLTTQYLEVDVNGSLVKLATI